ncbi:hypothetical protein GQ600_6101 [Phytophthora cactorum]|nr:hypothetical protein GQ600_6101 [Phytophthora cactorum]
MEILEKQLQSRHKEQPTKQEDGTSEPTVISRRQAELVEANERLNARLSGKKLLNATVSTPINTDNNTDGDDTQQSTKQQKWLQILVSKLFQLNLQVAATAHCAVKRSQSILSRIS